MILAILLAATTATATPEAPPPGAAAAPPAQAAATAPAKPAEKMICKTEVPVGTRFGKKVCRPASSYQAMGAEERKAVEQAQHGFSACGVGYNNSRC